MEILETKCKGGAVTEGEKLQDLLESGEALSLIVRQKISTGLKVSVQELLETQIEQRAVKRVGVPNIPSCGGFLAFGRLIMVVDRMRRNNHFHSTSGHGRSHFHSTSGHTGSNFSHRHHGTSAQQHTATQTIRLDVNFTEKLPHGPYVEQGQGQTHYILYIQPTATVGDAHAAFRKLFDETIQRQYEGRTVKAKMQILETKCKGGAVTEGEKLHDLLESGEALSMIVRQSVIPVIVCCTLF
ncbi:hypothetical protein QOT17_017855 [Balamuthia mandrillaris]